jgi:L-malate glycosyltransferase
MPKRLAVLYDCPFPFIQGGGQKRLFEISQYLLKHDWEVEWYALKFWDGPETIKHRGITFHAVGGKTELYDSSGKRRIWETIYYGAMIFRHIELRKFDILLAGQWPLSHLIPARIFCFLGKAKLVIDWWEVWGKDYWINYFGVKGILGLLLEKTLSQITSHIIAVSQKGKYQLQELGVKQNDILHIPNGIDFEKISNSKVKTKDFDLVYMGRLKDHKNVDHLVQAVSILKKMGDFVTLQIIGDGPERQNLELLVKKLNVSDNVIFHGEIESDTEAYSCMKASKLFIHPSTKEGGGSITVMEANACGLPVVAYKDKNGIADELIEEGINGFWVEKPNAKMLADRIRKLLLDENLGQNIRDDSIEYARRYDWSNIASEYNAYFFRVLDNKKEKEPV